MRLLSGKLVGLFSAAFLLKTMLLLGQEGGAASILLLWSGALTGAVVSAFGVRHFGKIRPRGSQEVSYRRALDLAHQLVAKKD